MKKGTIIAGAVCVALCIGITTGHAQLRTVQGDFFSVTRTVEESSDSIHFTADTLILRDSGSGLTSFKDKDSIAITFVQNRFRIVNSMKTGLWFDYVRVRNSGTSTLRFSRQTYAGVVTQDNNGKESLGKDPAQDSTAIGLRPVYRSVGAIAYTSLFNSDEDAIRQFLTFQIHNPSKQTDAIQISNIFIKPNINNLTGLAIPPDTTKDTLRAYLLDGSDVVFGCVISQTDLAIVRLLPGTTRILMWVKDSAQYTDAGEYIGSFGDYSRGRYFLGDDRLPTGKTRTKELRPAKGTPDAGMQIDGTIPESTPLRTAPLYQSLAPFWYTSAFPSVYPKNKRDKCANPNPAYGLIPPYRIGAYAVVSSGYQPALVTSAVDTLRFFDEWGNRTWDTETVPNIQALSFATGSPKDRTAYLQGTGNDGDMLRQTGQVVFRRLAYTYAGKEADSIRIVANAKVPFTDVSGNKVMLDALPDTSGGLPRIWKNGAKMRPKESDPDRYAVVPLTWTIDEDCPSIDGNAPPRSGWKIAIRPNIPRNVQIHARPDIGDERMLWLDILVTDAFGNPVDDNERFTCELAPYTDANGLAYQTDGVFDSVAYQPLDSGRVSIAQGMHGTAMRYFRLPDGDAAGTYRIRVRASYAFPDNNGVTGFMQAQLRLDPFPNGNPPTVNAYAHANTIPDGSPGNSFGAEFNAKALSKCSGKASIDTKLGTKPGQTTAIGWIDVRWDGKRWEILTK